MREVLADYDSLPNEPGTHWSVASSSIDWYKREFPDSKQDYESIGIVTGNPYSGHSLDDEPSGNIHEQPLGVLREVWRTEWTEVEGIETVPPEKITDHGIDVWRQREELGIDRLVLHYMQPHEPFRMRPDWVGESAPFADMVEGEDGGQTSVWTLLRRGLVNSKDVWEAYRDNLDWVLKDVSGRLRDNVDADIVLSSDHGNATGELGTWGHPRRITTPAVRKVPWVNFQGFDKGEIKPDFDDIDGGIDQREVSDRTRNQLESLGYR